MKEKAIQPTRWSTGATRVQHFPELATHFVSFQI